jgi:hypothetical protein
MSDILSTATVTTIKADAAKAVAEVDSTETGVVAFIKAHYTKVAFAAIGAGAVLLWKVF